MAFRAVHVFLDNRTRREEALVLTRAELQHGQWSIRPLSLVEDKDDWRSESKDVSFGTGTEGNVAFEARSHLGTILTLNLHWNNPFLGGNSYDASVSPDARTHPGGFSVGFFGDKRFNKEDDAEITFVLLAGNCSVNEDTGEVSCTSAGPLSRPSIWHHDVPSARQLSVAPGTSPTSWYTTPENVQHIAYVGTDQQIHECFFRIGGPQGWEHSVPSADRVKVASGTSPTSWYTTPENVQHIAYVGTDQQIHECLFRIGGTLGWEHSVPSARRVSVAPGTSPTSWYTTPDNLQHIAYVGTDQQIHECFFRIGGTLGWEHNIPSAGQVKVAPGTSPTSWYTTPENVQHIAYVGTDQQIHECFFFLGAGGDQIWRHSVPSAGQVKVAPGTSPTSWYTTPENVQHLAYVGTDQEIHQCFFFIGGFGGWRHEISSASNVLAAPGTSPTSWYSTPENVQHIAYVGTDEQIHECFFFIRVGGNHMWHHSVPSAGQVKVNRGTSPTSWYTTPENVQHIAYVGTDQQIHQCFFFVP
jgi:hypothetical protein